jgi:hypothetical protein
MEVGQGPSWGCSAKEKKMFFLDIQGHVTILNYIWNIKIV